MRTRKRFRHPACDDTPLPVVTRTPRSHVTRNWPEAAQPGRSAREPREGRPGKRKGGAPKHPAPSIRCRLVSETDRGAGAEVAAEQTREIGNRAAEGRYRKWHIRAENVVHAE